MFLSVASRNSLSLTLVSGPLWTLSPSDHQWWLWGGEESRRRRMRRWRGVWEEKEDMKRLSAPWGDLVHSSRAANSPSEWEREKGRWLLSKIKPVFMEKVKRQTSCNTSHDSKRLSWGWIKVYFLHPYKKRFSPAGCGGCWCAQGYQFLAGVDVHCSPWISIIVFLHTTTTLKLLFWCNDTEKNESKASQVSWRDFFKWLADRRKSVMQIIF